MLKSERLHLHLSLLQIKFSLHTCATFGKSYKQHLIKVILQRTMTQSNGKFRRGRYIDHILRAFKQQ